MMCFWRHVVFSVLWVAQGEVVRNPSLTDLNASRNPLISLHQALQQSPSCHPRSILDWKRQLRSLSAIIIIKPLVQWDLRNPSWYGHATLFSLVASKDWSRISGHVLVVWGHLHHGHEDHPCVWGEERTLTGLPGDHYTEGGRAGRAARWDYVCVVLSSAHIPVPEGWVKTHQNYGQPDLRTLLWIKFTFTEPRIFFGGWHSGSYLCPDHNSCHLCSEFCL